jgi:flagellar motor switch protein FliN
VSKEEVTPAQALMRLTASTAEAVAQVLEMYAPGLVQRGQVSVLPDASEAFSTLPLGAVAASVSYVNGITGANVFVMTPNGARALAVAMGVPAPEEESEEGQPIELSELELSAVSEASNQMMAAAASAIGMVLGKEVEISPPDTRVLDDTDSALDLFGTAPHATSASFTIGGDICRLIQLVPSAFVVRMVRAMDDQNDDESSDGDAPPDDIAADRNAGPSEDVGLADALTNIHVRVWAELGRARLPLGQAIELPLGAVVDLDCAADAPVDLYVNGLRFAQGQLLITDEGDWAVSLEKLGGPAKPAAPAAEAQPQTQGALT